ncbi:MAG: ATP-binding cassette domain-containing protein [Caldilineaceae bacterium]|nr:ATP-binding cassette domain-containing protein [Caldilineaceae bacterium]
MIQVRNLAKHFQVGQHREGLLGSLRNLASRQYKTVRAVDNISFEVQKGELVGYLGPNGAGKSTTIKILSGLLTPTSGEVRINGLIPWQERERYVHTIGAVFGQRTTLWWDLPVIDSLKLLQHIYRIPGARFQKNLADFRALLELDPFLNTPVRALSLGQRMRADICAAMLHDPDILFLDEPTIGLDVVAKDRIRQFIQHTNQERNATIVLTTHDLSDVEKLCQRVLIIDHGKLLFDGALDSLQERFGGKRELVVDLADEYDNVEVDGSVVGERTGRRVTYQFDRSVITASELIGRLSQRFRISDLSVREPDIEATIRRIYEERLLDAES